MTGLAERYNVEDERPFRGIASSAISRLRDRGRTIQQRIPYGPDWLKPTAPAHWRWDFLHLKPIFEALNALARRDIEGLMVFGPPRHIKTESITVRFPVWWLQQWPDQRVIVGMHTQQLANKISRKARRIAREWLRLDPEREAVEEWETVEGGGFRAVGVGVAVAGHGGNLICVDDPIRSRMEAESQTFRDRIWEWWTDDLFSRREPHAAQLLSMARWHEDDLAGRILNSPDAKNWYVISQPALAEVNDPLGRKPGQALCPERYDEKALARIQLVEGSYGFSGLYQQRPSPAEGGIFKRAWWQFWEPQNEELGPVYVKDADGKRVERIPVKLPIAFDQTGQSWDMSFKGLTSSDQVAGHVWSRKGSRAFLRARKYDRMDFPDTLKAVRAMTREWPIAKWKWVEDKANGPAVISMLRGEIPGLIGVNPDGDKVARAHAITYLCEAGNVFLPHPSLCPWVWDVIEIFAKFPNTLEDHDVDAGVQALRKLFPQGAGEESTSYQMAHTASYAPRRSHA
jgi:predicted phage terminase large subunit-like protein